MRSRTAMWFECKIRYEKTEKEKRSRVTYLVQAASLKGALKGIEEVMGGTMIDYEAANIDETNLMDVFEYKKSEE